jgi:hypothetical protein
MSTKPKQSLNQSIDDLRLESSMLRSELSRLKNELNSQLPRIELCEKFSTRQGAEIQAIINKANVKHRVDFKHWFIHHPFVVGVICAGVGFAAVVGITTANGKTFKLEETNLLIPIASATIGGVGASMAKSYEKQQQAGDAMLLSELKEVVQKAVKEVEDELEKKRKEDRAELLKLIEKLSDKIDAIAKANP